LNSDDFFEPNIFGLLVQFFELNPIIDAIVGSAGVIKRDIEENQSNLIIYEHPTPEKLLHNLTEGTPIFNAWIFKSTTFKEIGKFNTNYIYTADRDFLIRFYLQNKEFKPIDHTFYHYRQHPDSLTLSGILDADIKWMLETLELSETYIQGSDLNKEELRKFRSWHSQMTNDLIAISFLQKNYQQIWKFTWRGMKYNPIWLIKFLNRAGTRLKRSLTKNYQVLPVDEK
jgi:hypothetical protein